MNVSPNVSIAPTIDLHQEFAFAENTDTVGCCCCFKSKAVRPQQEVYVNHEGKIEKFKRKGSAFESRVRANAHLAEIVKSRFKDDPIANDEAFKMLRSRVNHDFDGGEITAEKLQVIVEAIYSLKKEISESMSEIQSSSPSELRSSDEKNEKSE